MARDPRTLLVKEERSFPENSSNSRSQAKFVVELEGGIYAPHYVRWIPPGMAGSETINFIHALLHA
jgi:hypothetical protein